MQFPKLRWLIVEAGIFNLVAFILAFLVLLQDIDHISDNDLQTLPIVTYNVSYVGRDAASRYPPNVAARIQALVPQAERGAPSVTRYLDGYDWYALYHFYICHGYYEVNEAMLTLTDKKIDEVCERKPRSYVFDLKKTLHRDLHPSVAAELADLDIPAGFKRFNVRASTAFLIIGIVFGAVNLVLLPFTMTGRLRLNRLTFFVAMMAMLAFIIAAGIDTGFADNARDKGIGNLCSGYLAMIWNMVGQSVLASVSILQEVYFEYWTPRGERITIWKKPRDADWRFWRQPMTHVRV
jgi:hypothetical protein